MTNPVLEAMMNRKSIRRYDDRVVPDEVVEAVVRAGQQAPFAAQLGSFLLSRDKAKNAFHAPLLFTICVDSHRLEAVMARRGWKLAMNDLALLLFGIQDATLAAENMVIAAESLGLGSCFLGAAPFRAREIAAEYALPPRVFPIVQLAMGYPAESPPPRPRYPLDFALFENRYPELSEELVARAMKAMDDAYLAEGYYRRAGYMVPLEDGRPESQTYETYGWTEHMGRKWGQWYPSAAGLLEQLAACGFLVPGHETVGEEDQAP
jgi:FMN reductase (NADPH)